MLHEQQTQAMWQGSQVSRHHGTSHGTQQKHPKQKEPTSKTTLRHKAKARHSIVRPAQEESSADRPKTSNRPLEGIVDSQVRSNDKLGSVMSLQEEQQRSCVGRRVETAFLGFSVFPGVERNPAKESALHQRFSPPIEIQQRGF